MGDFDQNCFSHGLHVFGFEVELGEAAGKIVSELAGEDSAITAVVLLWHFVRPGLSGPVIGQFRAFFDLKKIRRELFIEFYLHAQLANTRE